MAGELLAPETSWAFLVAGSAIKDRQGTAPPTITQVFEEHDKRGFRVEVAGGLTFHYVQHHTREAGAYNKTVVEERFYFPGELIRDSQGQPISPETPIAEQHLAVLDAVEPYVRLFPNFPRSDNSIHFGSSPDGKPEVLVEQLVGAIAECGGQRWEKTARPAWEIVRPQDQ